MVKLKSLLLGLMVIGAVAYFGGGGTFASFSAETTNSGSSIASGTLTMSDQVASGTVCTSAGAASGNNVNPSCASALTLTNLAPGVPSPLATAKITIQNTGSIDASHFYMFAAAVGSTLSAGLTGGASISSVPIAALQGSINSGDSILVISGPHTQTFIASAAVAGGATAIPVTAQNANFAYTLGSTVTDTSGNNLPGNTLGAALTSGTSYSSFTIAALQGTITSGDSIVLTSGANTQTYIASAGASPGATSITVTAQAANFAYPIGTTFVDISKTNNNCYDVKTTVSGTAGSSKGTDLNFNPLTGNPYCSALLVYVQETTGSKYYCWTGKGSSPEATNGMCVAPISVNPTGSVAAGVKSSTSLPVGALNGNVAAGDTLVITEGSKTDTLTESALGDAYFGATSLTVSGTLANSYTAAATIVDTSAQGTMNSDTTDTVSNFDTAHNGSLGKISLYPVTANGTVSMTNPVQLGNASSATSTRTFQLGVYMPAPSGTNQNPLQGLSSTFGITWHLDQ